MITPSRPLPGNKYYNTPPNGYSTCIIGNYPRGMKKRTGFPGLNTLPNCVGFAIGWLNESNEQTSFDLLPPVNAGELVAYARKKGFEISDHPTAGGVMVWRNNAAGHVCVVKTVLDENTVITAESEWNGAVYTEYTRRKSDGNWRDGCYWMGKNYIFAGCIRNPAFEVENMTIDELIESMTPEQAYKLTEKARAHAKSLPVANYAETACREAVSCGAAADGDGDGLADAPKASMLREEFFVILKRLGLLIH